MNIVRIENLSSCDFSCTGDKLRVKRSSFVINSTGQAMPNPYSAIVGVIPPDLKENATVIEIFNDKIGYWIQTSCDPTAYTWSTPIVVERCCSEGSIDLITTFILSALDGNRTVGSAPTVGIVLPANPTAGDTLVIKYGNCMTGFYTFDGTNWVLDYHQEDCFPSTVFVETANAWTGVLATDAPPTPGTYVGDTHIRKYTVNGRAMYGFWTWDGATWILNYTLDTRGLKNVHVDDSSNAAPTAPSVPGTGFPANPTSGDTVTRNFSDYIVWYTYDGSAWVEDFRTLRLDISGFDCTALVP